METNSMIKHLYGYSFCVMVIIAFLIAATNLVEALFNRRLLPVQG